MTLPNPKRINWKITDRYQQIRENLLSDPEIIIEGIGPDGVPNWWKGGREAWTQRLAELAQEYDQGDDQAALVCGALLLNQLLSYVDSIAADKAYEPPQEGHSDD